MNIVEIDEKVVVGLSARTANAKELNPETASIGRVWQKFDSDVTVNYQGGARVYGVYYNYESGADGEFDVLAGCEHESSSLDMVVIQKGKDLVFEGKARTLDDNARIQAAIEPGGSLGLLSQ